MPTVVNEKVKLDVCPFCGCEAHLKTDNINKQSFWVKCSNENCGISTMAREDEVSAMYAWNKRI